MSRETKYLDFLNKLLLTLKIVYYISALIKLIISL